MPFFVDLGGLMRETLPPSLRQRTAALLEADARASRRRGQRPLDGLEALAEALWPPRGRDAELVGIRLAASLLGCSTRSVERWISQGILPSVLVGNRVLIRVPDLQRLARSRPSPPVARPRDTR